MRIAVTGSTGLIGSALTRSLRAEGHDVLRLVRRPAAAADEVRWDPKEGQVEVTGLAGCEAVVHLAGPGVGDHRWTDSYKRELRDSRVLGTQTLARALAAMDTPPHTLIVGTAVGYYGDTGDRAVHESAGPGTGFLAELCQDWEAAAQPAQDAGIRTVFGRTGLVVARGGGAWGRLFPLFKAGLGGRLGDGCQYWSHIALHDHVAALRFLLEETSLSGPVNLTAPQPATNREVTAAMGQILHRPTPFAVPAPVLRLALGEFAQDVLGSQRVIPRRLMDAGFRFAFPTVAGAIRSAV